MLTLTLLALLTGCTSTEVKAPEPVPSPTPPPPPTALPDIVLITLDTTRADHLATYGYFRHTAPRLEALAEQSIVFERLVVPMATTLPTHTSLLTGVYPTEHGILANIEHEGRRFVPTDSLRTVTTWLADRGYRTGAFVSSAPLDRKSGVHLGFHVYVDPPRGKEQVPAQVTADAAIEWLKATTEAPLFLWTHFYDPHNPFNPPEAYAERFQGDEALDRWIEERQISATTRRPTGEIVRAKRSINLYDAEILYMDEQIGRVLDALAARGRFDDALIIVVGDHGEGLNQHGEPGHGLVWHEQLHAPLWIKAPGAAPRRVSATVSAVDVLPTAFGLIDLPGEDELISQMSGVDALKTDLGERWVLSQTSQRQLTFGREMTYTLTNNTWKCAWTEGAPVQLWNHTTDPYELADVAAAHPDVAAACAATLQEMVAKQKARAVELGAGETTEMSDEERAALKALGYVDDDGEAP
jgi:arylsulfatase A-like enzyme